MLTEHKQRLNRAARRSAENMEYKKLIDYGNDGTLQTKEAEAQKTRYENLDKARKTSK
jgi:hypothetical protein